VLQTVLLYLDLQRIALVCGGDEFEATFTNLHIFDLLPSDDELVAIKNAKDKEEAAKKPRSTYIPGDSSSDEMKIVVLGSGGVGKSATVVQYVQGVFVERYDPTIEDNYRKQVYYDNTYTMMDILDTASYDQFTAMRDLYMRNGDGFYLIYSLSDRASFDELREVRNAILRVKGVDYVPMVIAANKGDLPEKDIVVPAATGASLASEWNVPFFVTSAKVRQNIDEAFEALYRQVKEIKSDSIF